jgi:peptidyl-prolyl cis-trans isomerase C
VRHIIAGIDRHGASENGLETNREGWAQVIACNNLQDNQMKLKMKLRTTAALAALAGIIAFAVPANAQQADEKGNVAVKVNGHSITAAEVSMAADDILPQLADVPPKLRFAFIVEYLVERHLMAQAAVRAKMIESEEYKKRIRFYQAKSLRDAYFAEKIVPSITEDMIQAEYDRQVAKVKPEPRARARHILVATEPEAEEIKALIDKGENFEELAKKYSTDGSKDYGGDLGYFSAAEMVQEFSDAVFNLKKGEISGPVKTDDGWHIIKLEEILPGTPLPYDMVKGQIRLALLRNAVQDQVIKLREGAKIEIIDPGLLELADQVAEQRKLQNEKLQQGVSGKSDKQN